MDKVNRLLRGVFAIAILLTFSAGALRPASAQGGNPPLVRQTTLLVTYTQYEWWVIRWTDNAIMCQVFIDHEGLPSGDEILDDCGGTVYTLWKNTPPCAAITDGVSTTATCTGAYLFFIGSKPSQKEITVELPPPSVYIELTGCTPTIPEHRCDRIPQAHFTAEEPLPNEQITNIFVLFQGKTFTCASNTCDVPLAPTPRDGSTMEFWADSSFGDSSEHYTALVRVIDTGVSPTPGTAGWYVDVLSSQWRGQQTASCSQTWQALPPVGSSPGWLTTPEIPELLASAEPYYFLAGRMIKQNIVDARGCPNEGLLSNGWADECGLTAALPDVLAWQNQFDTRIIEVANDTGVPAQLMKNLFAQESQFWPGAFTSTDHMGLGHITDKGADTLLLWNNSFYKQFCPLVLEQTTCDIGYLKLDAPLQELLRGALASQAEAECPTCEQGIDLSKANFSVDLFARTLLANCEQVSQIVYNASKKTPGTVASYEDLWRITIANYHAGPGCISYAVYGAWSQGAPITWDKVKKNLTPVCLGVVGYVENIAK